MEITFLGHHSWLISSKRDNILVDPVLLETFGNSNHIQFEIFPFRKIDIDFIPKISAIILTNEHAGHFDIKSILRLKNVPIYVYSLIPLPVITVLQDYGIVVRQCYQYEQVKIGNISVYFCPGSQNVPLWESRVCNVIIKHLKESILIQSDTLISNKTVENINQGILPAPDGIIVPNNLQLFDDKVKGPFDNLLPLKDWRSDVRVGINHFVSLLLDTLYNIKSINYIFLSGSGFIPSHKTNKPFLFSEAKKISDILRPLLNYKQIHGLEPGNIFRIGSEDLKYGIASWIQLLEHPSKNSRQKNKSSLVPVQNKIYNADQLKVSVHKAAKYLDELSPYFLSSDVGKDMVSINTYFNKELAEKRAVFRLVHPKMAPYYTTFYFDCNRCEFIKEQIATEDLISMFPFGIEMGLEDFICVCEGEIQIWDLSMCAIRQWFVGSHLRSITAFLFEYFSEQIRTDLFSKILVNANH